MKVTIVTDHDFINMPWKNGQGFTLQLACSHPTIEYFDWRISIADVKQDSSFSYFNDKYRIISVLNGHGLVLNNQSTQKTISLNVNEIYYFSGEDQIDSKLVNGPIRDFNLIYNPKKYTAEMHWHNSIKSEQNLINTELFFIFNVYEANLTIQIDRQLYTLKPQELLKIEKAKQLNINMGTENHIAGYYTIKLISQLKNYQINSLYNYLPYQK